MARARSEYSATYAKNRWFLTFHSDMKVGARRARKCARAKIFFRIEKFMKFATFYVFWIFSYLLNWLMWVPLKCVFFFQKIWVFAPSKIGIRQTSQHHFLKDFHFKRCYNSQFVSKLREKIFCYSSSIGLYNDNRFIALRQVLEITQLFFEKVRHVSGTLK